MANLTEASTFDAGVYQLDVTDIVQGGPGGVDNRAPQNLANRTRWLFDNKLPLSAGVNYAMTGTIYGSSSASEFARLVNVGGYISGWNAANTLRTGYLQFNAGSDVTLAAENGAIISLTTAGLPRLQIPANGHVLIGGITDGLGSVLAINGAIGIAQSTSSVSGIFGAATITDAFTTDTNKVLHNYGLAWKTFTDSPLGPAAALTGYGGVRLYVHGGFPALIADVNGRVGIGGTSAGASLDVLGNALGSLQAVFARGGSDTNFQLAARNGSGAGVNTQHATFGMEYAGSAMAAGFSFYRGSGAIDGTLVVDTNGIERVFFTPDGATGFGARSPGDLVYVAGNIRTTSGVLFPTGQLSSNTGYLQLIASAGNLAYFGSNGIATIQVDVTGTKVGVGGVPASSQQFQVYGNALISGNLTVGNGSITATGGAMQISASSTNRITLAAGGVIWGALSTGGAFTIGGSDSGTGMIGMLNGGASNSGYLSFYSPAGTRQGYMGFSPTNSALDTGILDIVCGTLRLNGSAVVNRGDFTGANQVVSGTTGHQDMPGGVFLMKWQDGSAATTEVSQTITFPTPFPTACVHVQVTTKYPAGDAASNAHFQVVSFNRFGVTVFSQSDVGSFPAVTPSIFAIGN